MRKHILKKSLISIFVSVFALTGISLKLNAEQLSYIQVNGMYFVPFNGDLYNSPEEVTTAIHGIRGGKTQSEKEIVGNYKVQMIYGTGPGFQPSQPAHSASHYLWIMFEPKKGKDLPVFGYGAKIPQDLDTKFTAARSSHKTACRQLASGAIGLTAGCLFATSSIITLALTHGAAAPVTIPALVGSTLLIIGTLNTTQLAWHALTESKKLIKDFMTSMQGQLSECAQNLKFEFYITEPGPALVNKHFETYAITSAHAITTTQITNPDCALRHSGYTIFDAQIPAISQSMPIPAIPPPPPIEHIP